ncbi:MAG TPA: hypothetical protein VF747_15050 [Blastocatellia bacterium]|jgi:hypothetical protein
MVTINNLDVRFDVEGSGDEENFARLFEKYANKWNRKQEEARARERRSESERAVGDRPEEY